MSTERNIAAQEAFGEAVNTGDLDTLAELVTDDVVDHDPAPGQGPGPAGFRTFFTELRVAFPDLHLAVEHLVASADDVAFAYTVSGTHRGDFQGHPPTGRTFSVRGVQIGRFSDDARLAERWGSSDQLGIRTQLGLA